MKPRTRRLLDAMIDDMNAAPEIYRPTSFWSEGAEKILRDLESTPIESFRRMPSALLFFVPTYAAPGHGLDPARYAAALDALTDAMGGTAKARAIADRWIFGEADAAADYRVYLAAANDGPPHIDRASESAVGDPVEQFTFDGRRFGRSFLNYLLGLSFLKRVLGPVELTTVLEIGGGFGTLGEILLQDPRNDALYIDVDIPPTAVFSDFYLRRNLGDDAVADYLETRDLDVLPIDDLRTSRRAAVLCPWQLPRLRGSVDLFVNFISFQEMEPHVVANYLSQVSRLEARYVLLRNIEEGKQRRTEASPVGVETPILGDDYDGFLPGYDLVTAQTVPFGLATADGFHSSLRLYARRG